MNKKIVISTIVAFLLVAVIGQIGMYTYARYASEVEGTSTATAAAWVIKVNEVDIVADQPTTLDSTLALTLDENENVAEGKIAPGRGGHFDIKVDATGTEVTVDYTVALGAASGMPTGMSITGYKINGGDLISSTTIPAQTIAIGGAAQTITVYVEWTNSDANNTTDTAAQGTSVEIPVTVTVSQKTV